MNYEGPADTLRRGTDREDEAILRSEAHKRISDFGCCKSKKNNYHIGRNTGNYARLADVAYYGFVGAEEPSVHLCAQKAKLVYCLSSR